MIYKIIGIFISLVLITAGCRSVPQASGTQSPTPGPTITPNLFGEEAIEKLKPALDFLKEERDISSDQVSIKEFEAVEWPDSCLGLSAPGQACLQVITPGYRAVLDTPEGEFVIHLDSNGSNFRLASEPGLPKGGLPVISWERSGGIAGICHRLTIFSDNTYLLQDCITETTLSVGTLSSEDAAFITSQVNRFRPFEYEFVPPQGSADMFSDKYSFAGKGSEDPTLQEQEAINEFLGNLSAKL